MCGELMEDGRGR